MAFGDADIVEPARKARRKRRQPCTAAHGGGNGDEVRVICAQFGQRFSKYLGKVFFFLRERTVDGVKRADAVVFFRLALGVENAASLLRDDVQQHRLAQVARPAQHALQLFLVVTVHRADVIEPHIVKHIVREDTILDGFFYFVKGVV